MKQYIKWLICFLGFFCFYYSVFVSADSEAQSTNKLVSQKQDKKKNKTADQIVPKKKLKKLKVKKKSVTESSYNIDKLRKYTEIKGNLRKLKRKIVAEREQVSKEAGEKLVFRHQGSLRTEAAYRIYEPKEFTKIKNQLLLTETRVIGNLLFKIVGRFYYDAVFDLVENLPEKVKSDQRTEAELREAYLDYSFGPLDLRLGKQQIVWGEVIGLFFADIVNAKDLREYVLTDFNLIRIPQWAADLECSKGDFHLEFVWLPILEFHRFAVPGSEFAFPTPAPLLPGPQKPGNNLKNSESGGRLSYLLNSWDFSVFYLHSWNKFPVFCRTINYRGYYFYPEYKRQDFMGATFSEEAGDAILKGEFILNQDSYFSTRDLSDTDGVIQRNLLDYVLGIDRTYFEKIDTNFQFMQRIIFDYTDLLINEKKIRSSVSFWAQTGFLSNKLELEFMVIADLKEPDFLYRPKINLSIKDNWQVRLGVDIFKGDPSGNFGQFEKKSRFYSEIIYNF